MISTSLDICSLIPQRPPFVMIGSLLHCDEKLAKTGFKVTSDNIFVEHGKFTEPGLVENIAQTAAARAGYISFSENKPVQVGYIGAVKDLQVFALPLVDDELETEITLENQVFDVTVIKGKTWCRNVLIAQCEMKIFISQSK